MTPTTDQDLFFERPILNSPYDYPGRHWELDEEGQPTHNIIDRRRLADFISAVPKAKRRRRSATEQAQFDLVVDEGHGLSSQDQLYRATDVINQLRKTVDQWREIPNPNDWRVTPETVRLLQHWRHHVFSGIRPFFCQIEAVEVAIWLTEVAPKIGKEGRFFLDLLSDANEAANKPNGLFFAGDLGQRIFQTPFSWKSLGVDIRGRSRTLRINYRTSHQIRRQADRLLPPSVADVDGNSESRQGTVSVFNGAEPTIRRSSSGEDEQTAIATWLRERQAEGVAPHEMGVFVRSAEQLPRAKKAITDAGLEHHEIDADTYTTIGKVSVSPMHLAKGLEFKAVVVAACDEDVIPLQSRIESIADEADLEDVYDTERHLLYVACTRARDHLLLACITPGSEFLDDMSLSTK